MEPNDYQEISAGNVLSQIWLKPTRTLHYILQYHPQKYVFVLLALGGVVRALDRASTKNMGDKMSIPAVLAFAIIGGGLFGWITYYFYAWLMSVTGRWLNGHASSQSFRTVIAWSLIPSIASLVLLVPDVLLLNGDIFRSEPTQDSTFHTAVGWLLAFLRIVLATWTLVIMTKGIALIQGFRYGRAFLNLILPGLLIIIPLVLIGMLFAAFA